MSSVSTEIESITKGLDLLLIENKKYTVATIEAIEKRANNKSTLKKLLLMLGDFLSGGIPVLGIPAIWWNPYLTSKSVKEMEPMLHEIFTSNTKFHMFEYESFFPNAFTIPGSLVHQNSTTYLAQTNIPYIMFLTHLKFLFLSLNQFDDFNPANATPPIDLKIKDVTIFYSDALIRRCKLTEKELLAVLCHEIGHHTQRKTHTMSSLFWLINFLLIKLNFKFLNIPIYREVYLISLIMLSLLLIVRIYSRRTEYGSDIFAKRVGLGLEMQSALNKVYQTMAYGSKEDTVIERLFSFLPRVFYIIENLLSNLPFVDHPSNQQRQKALRTQESVLLIENSSVDLVYDNIVNILYKYLKLFTQ